MSYFSKKCQGLELFLYRSQTSKSYNYKLSVHALFHAFHEILLMVIVSPMVSARECKQRHVHFTKWLLHQGRIQSFSEIDAMCCVWPDEGGYTTCVPHLYIYRSRGANGGGGGGA